MTSIAIIDNDINILPYGQLSANMTSLINRKYITYRNAEPEEDRATARTCTKVSWGSDIVVPDMLANRQTNRQRQTDGNTRSSQHSVTPTGAGVKNLAKFGHPDFEIGYRERKCTDRLQLAQCWPCMVWPLPMLKYKHIFQTKYTEAHGNCYIWNYQNADCSLRK